MCEKQNELVDKIQAKLGRVLSSHEKELLETKDYLSLPERDFPFATKKLLQSWKVSFRKIAIYYTPLKGVDYYAGNSFIRQFKQFNKNFPSICIAHSLLLIIVIGLYLVLDSNGSVGRVTFCGTAGLLLGVISWMILETRRLLFQFKKRERLKAIILDLVDDSPGLKEIYVCTPSPWREIFLGSPPNDLEGMAKLVGWNLDWYISRPQVNFRWSWVAWIVIPTSMFVLIFWVEHNIPLIPLSLLGINAVLVIHSLESWRKLTGLALLIEETKRIFSETKKK